MSTVPTTPPSEFPPSGRATVKGREGSVLVRWVSEGPLTDVTLDSISSAGDRPAFPVADELRHATARAVADVVSSRRSGGQTVRLFGSGHDHHDEVVAAVADEVGLVPQASVLQYRRSLPFDGAGTSPATVTGFDADRHAAGATALWGSHAMAVRGIDQPEVIVARQRTAPGDERILVAEGPAGEVWGACTVRVRRMTPTGPPLGEVAVLTVTPDARNQGVARQLLGAAQDLFAADDTRTVAVFTSADAAEARSFLEHLGFKRRREVPIFA